MQYSAVRMIDDATASTTTSSGRIEQLLLLEVKVSTE
jgi:hypothetical protein